MNKTLKSLLLALAGLAALLVQSPATAQSDEEAFEDQLIEEVMVTGIRRSLDFAADIKRDSNTVVDAITAQDIGLFSDNNIGEALAHNAARAGFDVTVVDDRPAFANRAGRSRHAA